MGIPTNFEPANEGSKFSGGQGASILHLYVVLIITLWCCKRDARDFIPFHLKLRGAN